MLCRRFLTGEKPDWAIRTFRVEPDGTGIWSRETGEIGVLGSDLLCDCAGSRSQEVEQCVEIFMAAVG